MKTAVVILNYNTEDFLRDFLPRLISSVEKVEGAEIIVADNDSSDDSLAVMNELFPQVRTIVFEKNFINLPTLLNNALENFYENDIIILYNEVIRCSRKSFSVQI